MRIAAFVSALMTTAVVCSAAATPLSDLDGKYRYLGYQDGQTQTNTFTIKDAKLDFGVAGAKPTDIRVGPQEDFAALLAKKGPIPAGTELFSTDLSDPRDSTGRVAKVTIVKQTQNQERPRLTFIFVNDGKPGMMLQAFDESQKDQP